MVRRFMVHVTAHPSKIFDALDASVAVLRDIEASPISRRELARCGSLAGKEGGGGGKVPPP